MMVGDKRFSLKAIDCQHDFSGNIDQAVCLYAADAANMFTVIATRVVKNGMRFLTIGERAATAWPFSYTSMAYFPNSHIIFPMCEATSLHLRRLWREAKQPENAFIISGQFADSAALYLNSFRGHPVTLITQFSRDGFLAILDFARRLLNAGVLSVSVYPWPIKNEDEASDAVKTALANGGDAVVRLNYTKCNVPPRLNEKHEVYHLPVGEPWRYIEGNVTDVEPFEPAEWCNEPECPVASLPCSEDAVELDADVTDTGVVHDDTTAVPATELKTPLTSDQQRLYALFQADITRLSRSDVEKALDWGEDKAGNELKTLKDMASSRAPGVAVAAPI